MDTRAGPLFHPRLDLATCSQDLSFTITARASDWMGSYHLGNYETFICGGAVQGLRPFLVNWSRWGCLVLVHGITTANSLAFGAFPCEKSVHYICLRFAYLLGDDVRAAS